MLQQRLSRSLQTLAKCSSPLGLSRAGRSSFPIQRIPVAALTSQRVAAQRWYSSAQEAQEKPDETIKEQASSEEAPKAEAAQEDPLKKELDEKKKEAVELTDRLKRSIAEYRNLQEQTKREVQAARDFALQRFAKDLLDSIDNLDRALSTVPAEKLTSENQDLVNLHSGLKMTDEILMSTLKKHGLERFDPSESNDTFDPSKHEATFQTPMKDKQDGTVFYTQSKGFLYNGRVLRAAKVGVVKNS